MDFTKLKMFMDSLDAFDVRCMDVSVHKSHKEVFRYAIGTSDAEGKKPVTPDNLQWMYSMSKVITCTAVMRLVERGELGLDDKVSKYLPEYENMLVKRPDGKITPAENDLLIRHLFSMRSGMTYDLAMTGILKQKARGKISTRELVRGMAEEPLIFEPGTDYNYSLSHDVLAAVAEVITGKTFHEFLRDEIFIPLEIPLDDIGFHPTEAQKKRFTQKYTYDMEMFRCIPTDMNCAYRLSEEYESGGAGLFATLDAYMKIVDALSCKGIAENGYKVLSMESINRMRTNEQTEKETPKMKEGYGYGLGVRTMMDKKAGRSLGAVGEYGWDGAACSYTMIDPDNEIAVVLTLHICGFGMCYRTIHPKVRNLVYEGLGLATSY